MQRISEQELIDGLILRAKRGSFILTIEALTDARCKKNGNPYGPILKRAKINGIANWIYERAVNAQRVRENSEPDFKSHPRKWGSRIKGTPLVLYAGKTYLEIKVQQSLGHTYETPDSTLIPADALKQFLPTSREGRSRQGLEKEIIIRDYPITSILSAKIDGETYTIIRPAP